MVWAAAAWGWNCWESLVNLWAVSHTQGEISWAHPYCSSSFPLQFGCALQELFWLSGAINSATLCWHQDKKPPLKVWLGGIHPFSCHLELLSRGMFERCQSKLCPHHDPEKFLWPQSVRHEIECMSQPWRASSALSYHWGQQNLGKHGGLQVVVWTSKDGILNNYLHGICCRNQQGWESYSLTLPAKHARRDSKMGIQSGPTWKMTLRYGCQTL